MEALKTPLFAQASAHTLLHLALVIPPRILPHTELALAFLPPILACNIYTYKSGLGFLSIAHSLWSLELLFFRNPREKFCIIRDAGPLMTIICADGKGRKEHMVPSKEGRMIWREFYPELFWRRLGWVINLTCSLRYVGWQTSPQPKATAKFDIPPSGLESRFKFLVREMLRVGLCLAIMDTISFYQNFDPYFQISTPINEPFPRRLRSFLALYHLHHLPPQLVRILILGTQHYATFSVLQAVPAIVFVTLGGLRIVGDFWGGTQNWKSAMGSPTAVMRRGLRGVWGGFWHQYLRNMLSGPGSALASVLGLLEKSFLAYSIKIIVAFTVSSFLHVSTLPDASSPDFTGLDPLRYATFFWIQGALVLVEAVSSGVSEGILPKRLTVWQQRAFLGVVRLGWAGGVMYWSAPLIVDELTKVSRAFGLREPLLLKLPAA